MEVETGLFEGQAAVIQYATNLGFQVPDHIFILHIQYSTRHYFVPVVHKSLILKVILAKLSEIIGKGLALGKQLLVAAKTTVQGVTAGVDDLGVGQSEP